MILTLRRPVCYWRYGDGPVPPRTRHVYRQWSVRTGQIMSVTAKGMPNYSFTAWSPATYTIRELRQEGWRICKPKGLMLPEGL